MSTRFQLENFLPEPTPDFDNLLAVLACEIPSRPTLFEFFLNQPLYRRLATHAGLEVDKAPQWLIMQRAFWAAGYDYMTISLPGFFFTAGEQERSSTISLNEGTVIQDRKSFDAYDWPDPEAVDYSFLETVGASLPEGMKLIVHSPGGVLENVIRLVGYEQLCMLIVDDEQLVYDIFEQVGSRLTKMYVKSAPCAAVGAFISNDDWGFNTQTMLSPADMRRFVFPWHKEISTAIHAGGRPAILHSCGYYGEVIEDVIGLLGYEARHSYEDVIEPVETAYDSLHGRIAVLGGIDVDFVCRHSPEEVYERSRAMLERSASLGGYALGTGNSVPEYVPQEGYAAMIKAAVDSR